MSTQFLTAKISNPFPQTPFTLDGNGRLTSWPIIQFFNQLTTAAGAAAALQSPLDYGAAGDGVTDDTAAIAQCCATVGYLWLPAGVTFVTQQLTITSSGFCIFGGGALQLASGAGTDLLYLDGSAFTGDTYPGNGMYCHIFNVQLLGNAANQPVGSVGACLVLRNAAYTTVQDCLLYGASGDGIRLENFNGSYSADECNLINNRIFSNGRHGIFLEPTSDSGTFGHVGDHVIHSNHCNYNGVAGIRGTRLTSTIISNNNVLTNAVGIYLDAADRCTIIGNACRNNKGSGVIIDEDQSGNGFGRAEQILIRGNQLHYNNVQVGGTTSADELDVFHCDGCVIDGNYLGDTDFTPVAWYGIQIADCTGMVIVANTFGPTQYGPLLAPTAASGQQQVYRSANNVGLADGMQGTQANLPAPAENDYGVLYTVTDFEHTLLWIGDQWVFAPCDPGSGWCVNSSGGALTAGVWAVCDGSNTTILQGGGTLATVATPSTGYPNYMRR